MCDKQLTDEEAEALLSALSRHFGEPVQPVSRYCKALTTWQEALHERAVRLQEELYPGIHDSFPYAESDRAYELQEDRRAVLGMGPREDKEIALIFDASNNEVSTQLHEAVFGGLGPPEPAFASEFGEQMIEKCSRWYTTDVRYEAGPNAQYEKYKFEKAKQNEPFLAEERFFEVSDLRSYEGTARDVDYVFLQIRKSSLLARLIYGGEKLRTRMCPLHKLTEKVKGT